MGWEEVSRKYIRFTPGSTHTAVSREERLLIRQLIREEFPELEDGRIDAAVDQCCDSIRQPLESTRFFRCLSTRLGQEHE